MLVLALCLVIFLPERRQLARVYAVFVCLFVRLSQDGVLLKRLNVGSRKEPRTIAQVLWFRPTDAENLGKTQTGSPPTEAPNAGGVS